MDTRGSHIPSVGQPVGSAPHTVATASGIGWLGSRSVERPRLTARLDEIAPGGLALVTGPAGSGKTTLAAGWAHASGARLAWVGLDGPARSADTLTSRLAATVWGPNADAIDLTTSSPSRLARAVRDAGPTLLVLDDFHELHGSEAEAVVAEVLRELPSSWRAVVVSRSAPGIDLSRVRLSGRLVEIGADDLRFRLWEIERLFTDVYEEPLRPDELAQLERKSGGWAAGLQLFHLATVGKSASERRDTLERLSSRLPSVRDFLARNVLDDLPVGLRTFLLDTCVLMALTAPLCDSLRDADDSAEMLSELSLRNVFISRGPLDDAYRYHEVFRSLLEELLVEVVGEAEMRRRFRRAGSLLEAAGQRADAVYAYSRADAGVEVARLLEESGHALAEGPGRWIDALPPVLRDRDAWVVLAKARRLSRNGDLDGAIRAYDEASTLFGTGGFSAQCREERQRLSVWLPGSTYEPEDWMGRLRRLLRRGPAEVPPGAGPGVELAFTSGLRDVLGGRENSGLDKLGHLSCRPSAPPVLGAIAELVAAVLEGLREPPTTTRFESLAQRFRTLELPWAERVAVAARALSGEPSAVEWADQTATRAEVDGDRWMNLLARSFAAVGRIWSESDVGDEMADLADLAVELGMGGLEPQFRLFHAVAHLRAGTSSATEPCHRAESAARRTGARAVQAASLRFLAIVGENDPSELNRRAKLIERECGVDLDGFVGRFRFTATREPTLVPNQAPSARAVVLRCFGPLSLEVGGQAVDLARLKPRVRSLLKVLALFPGRGAHRDTLLADLWPEVPEPAGRRSLQVAVSALRRFLEPEAPRGSSNYVIRHGETYELALPPGSDWDVRDVGRLTREGTLESLGEALGLYRGVLFEGEGSAEWVVGPRHAFAVGIVNVATTLAGLQLEAGLPEAALTTCRTGLEIDVYRDELWRSKIAAFELLDQPAEAAKARVDYDRLLESLGCRGGG